MKPYEVELLTPHELNLMIENYNQITIENRKQNVMYCYYSAIFQRNKDPNSDLETILESISNEEMTDEKMYSIIQRMARG